MKDKRQKLICDLIRKYTIETQEELAQILGKNGLSVTQTTVSRDIKELKLVKVLSEESGTYKYTLPDEKSIHEKKHTEIFEKQLTGVSFCNNLVILKTSPGAAMLVARAVDSLHDDSILGTVSGFDTVFVATNDHERAKTLHSEIKKFIQSEASESKR